VVYNEKYSFGLPIMKMLSKKTIILMTLTIFYIKHVSKMNNI